MCTVTWRPCGDNGYDLFFNRDESRRRTVASPPAAHGEPGRRYLCATDPEGGGTWLAVAEDGTTTALLNHYEAQAYYSPAFPRSRGQLVVRLAAGEGLLEDTDLTPYRPFLLVRVALPLVAELWQWDGRALTQHRAVLPVSTSSFETQDVLSYRRCQFGRAPDLETFHRQQDPDRTSYSVLMARPDTRTVSLSHITAEPRGITYRYYDPPEAREPTSLTTL